MLLYSITFLKQKLKLLITKIQWQLVFHSQKKYKHISVD